MSHFFAVSLKPEQIKQPSYRHLFAQAESLFERFTVSAPLTVQFDPGFHILVSSMEATHFYRDPCGNFCLLVPLGCYHLNTGETFTPQSLLEKFLREGIGLAEEIAPPWAICLGIHQEKKVICATDSQGLQHLYSWSENSVMAVSSSCLMLGAWSGAEIDLESMGVFARVGNYLRDQTPFRGVRKLPAGSYLSVGSGNAEMLHYRKPVVVPFTDRKSALEAGLEVLSSSIGVCLKAFPDAGIELSGGLDSRLIFAAIPIDRRGSRRALTLGYPGSPDCVIAERLAREGNLRHQVIDLAALDDCPCEELVNRVKKASEKAGHGANPFSRRVLDWVNEFALEGPRFSGQNGEFARGFFYAGQPDAGKPTPALVDSLMKWRIFTNQSVNLEIFRKDLQKDIEEAARRGVQDCLLSSGQRWLSATDEFYLLERMQRWVGADYSSSSHERIILAPFFHPRFIQWASGVPPLFKRGGNLMAELLTHLDSALGQIPLDSGYLPRDLAHPHLQTHLRQKADFFKKVAHKAWQRLLHRGKPPVGAELLSRRVQQHYQPISSLLPRVWQSGILDPSAMYRLERGTTTIDWVTVGFLLQYEWLLEIVETRVAVTG